MCPVAGGKDAKKQKLGDGTLPQSMLSNYLRKGEQLPPSLQSLSCIISARALPSCPCGSALAERRCLLPGAAKSTSKSSKAAKAAAAHVDEEQLMNRSFSLSRTRTPSYHLKIRCCCSMLGDMKTSGRAARGARAQKAAFSSSAYKPSSTRVHDMGEDIAFQAEMGDLPEIEDADAGPAAAAAAGAGAQDQVASPGGPNVSGVVSIPGFLFWAQTQPEHVACRSQLLRRRRRRTRRRSRQVTTVRSNASRFRLPGAER